MEERARKGGGSVRQHVQVQGAEDEGRDGCFGHGKAWRGDGSAYRVGWQDPETEEEEFEHERPAICSVCHGPSEVNDDERYARYDDGDLDGLRLARAQREPRKETGELGGSQGSVTELTIDGMSTSLSLRKYLKHNANPTNTIQNWIHPSTR